MTNQANTLSVMGRKKTSGIHKTPRVAVQLPEHDGWMARVLSAVGFRSMVDEFAIALSLRAKDVGIPEVLPSSVLADLRKLKDASDRRAIRAVLESHGLWPPPDAE